MRDVVVVIDRGVTVETLGNIVAYMWNSSTGIIEFYKSPTQKICINTHAQKVIFKRGKISIGIFSKGRILNAE